MLTPVGITRDEYIEALKSGNATHARITFVDQNVVFTDSDITSEGIAVQTFLNGETDLTIGRAVMTEVTVSLFRTDKTIDLNWQDEFTLEFGVDVEENGVTVTEWVTVGYFAGTRPERSVLDNVISFSASDRMHLFDIEADEYLQSITYSEQNPVSLSTIYTGLCTFCGVTSVSGDELANIMSRTFTVTPFESNGLTCRDVLAKIAEACGCYAKITADGKVKMVWYQDHTEDYTVNGDDEFSIYVMELDMVTSPALKMKWIDLENTKWEDLEHLLWGELEGEEQPFKVLALRVKLMEEDTGVTIPASMNRNVYLIVDNDLLATADQTDITNYLTPLYNRLADFGAYIPASANCVGNWLVEAGDVITVEVGNRNYIRLPIFTRTLKWNGSCTDDYEATGNLNREAVSASNRKTMAANGRFHIFRNDINQLYSEINDPATGLATKVDQTSQALNLLAEKVNAIYRMPTDPANDPSITLNDGDIWIDTSYVHEDDASAYDPTATYSKGDYCIHSDKVFKCNTDITTAEAWDPTHWDEDEYKNQWYQYDLTNTAWVEVDDNTKYAVQSGIEITANGVEISGNKYIHMQADSNNRWEINDKGLSLRNLNRQTYYAMQFGGQFDAQSINTEAGVYAYNPNGDTTHGRIAFVALDAVNGYYNFVFMEYDYNTKFAILPSYNYAANIGKSGQAFGHIYAATVHALNALTGNSTTKELEIHPSDNDARKVTISDNTSAGEFQITGRVSGNLYQIRLYGVVSSISSRNQKHSIKALEDAGTIIDKLKPVSFAYNNDPQNRKHLGLIYEDTVDVLPEICDETKQNNSPEIVKSINYVELVPLLLKEIQDLRKRVAELEKEVRK